MLTAGSQRAGVCLRCQLRLTEGGISYGSHARLRLPRQNRPSVNATCPNTFRKGFASSSSPTETNGKEEDHEKDQKDDFTVHTEASGPWQDRLRKDFKIIPGLKKRVASLGHDRLGEPADVIILKDAGLRSTQSSFGPLESSPAVEVIEIGADKSASSFPTGPTTENKAEAADVFLGLDQLRDEYEKDLDDTGRDSRAKRTKLRQAVKDGFTALQLKQYIKLRAPKILEWRGQPSHWISGTAEFPPSKPNAKAADKKRRQISYLYEADKTFLTNTIFRAIWRVGRRQAEGYIDYSLKPHEMSLLVSNNAAILKSLTTSHNVRFDTSRRLGVLRMKGRIDSCYSANETFQSYLRARSVTKVPIPPNFRSSKASNDERRQRVQMDALHAQLSDHYGVVLNETDRNLEITTFKHLPKRVSLARRDYLLALQKIEPQSLRGSDVSSFMSGAHGAHKYSYRVPDTMPWNARHFQWYRWASPSSLLGKPAMSDLDALTQSTSDQLWQYNRHFQNRGLKEESTAEIAQMTQVLEASVGRILHSGLTEASLKGSLCKAPLQKQGQRLLLAEFPGLAKFLATTPGIQSTTRQLYLLLTPVPSKTRARDPPSVLIEYDSVSTESRPQLRVKALIDQRDLDLMLPENAVDIRFSRKTYFDISSYNTGDLASRFKTLATTSLPPFLHVSVPRALYKGLEGVAKVASGAATTVDKVEYMVQPAYSIDSLDMAYFSYQGYTLRYTDPVNAKQPIAGIPKKELVLQMHPSATQRLTEKDKPSMEEFYRTACTMAFEIGNIDATDLQKGQAVRREESAPVAAEEENDSLYLTGDYSGFEDTMGFQQEEDDVEGEKFGSGSS